MKKASKHVKSTFILREKLIIKLIIYQGANCKLFIHPKVNCLSTTKIIIYLIICLPRR